VTRVSTGRTSYQVNGQYKPVIVIEADRTIKLGSSLSEARRDWLLAALHELLIVKSKTLRMTTDRPSYLGQ
jgi:hypothetical protein